MIFLAVISLVIVKAVSRKNVSNSQAKVYFKQSLVTTIDLSKAPEEETDFVVQGEHGNVTVTYHKNEIKIKESNCPHQYCVHKGYISKTNDPIICAYNGVQVIIESPSLDEVII